MVSVTNPAAILLKGVTAGSKNSPYSVGGNFQQELSPEYELQVT